MIFRQQMMEKVTKLKDENEKLEDNIKILSKELSILKDIFLAHAGEFQFLFDEGFASRVEPFSL